MVNITLYAYIVFYSFFQVSVHHPCLCVGPVFPHSLCTALHTTCGICIHISQGRLVGSYSKLLKKKLNLFQLCSSQENCKILE